MPASGIIARVDEIAQQARAAMIAHDWEGVRALLHPYLRWTDADGITMRGRSVVLAMLKQAAAPPAEPASVELRDGQIYRWRS